MRQSREVNVERWRGLVSEQVASGKTVAAFCRDRGLRNWQMYEWKRRFRATEVTPFVAVEVVAAAASSAESGIEIRHRRGWSLIVTPGFDASHLLRLVTVLERVS